ncbi:MAG: YidC/Oxa1 family membrane protein insertase [Actinomycetota bacterium]
MDQVFGALLRGIATILAALYDFVGNYGIAIVLLTIVIRVALLPLTIKQVRSMAEMQQIQPLVKEIQRKHKGNRQKLNEELMAVYKEHRVNPLGGCLPLLMQAPFFIALYAVLNAFSPAVAIPAGDDFRAATVRESFCQPVGEDLPRISGLGSNEIRCTNGEEQTVEIEEWVAKSGGRLNADTRNPPPQMFRCIAHEAGGAFAKDHLKCESPRSSGHLPKDSELYRDVIEGAPGFLGMELSCSPTQSGSEEGMRQCSRSGARAGGAPLVAYWGLVVLMVGTTWYQQRQMQQMSGQSNPQMVMMGRIMPVFLGFISLSIPAGVLLYWVTTNLWQVGQQRVMMRSRLKKEAAGAPAPRADGQRKGGTPSLPKGGNGQKRVESPPQKRPAANRGGSGRSGGGSRKKRRKR